MGLRSKQAKIISISLRDIDIKKLEEYIDQQKNLIPENMSISKSSVIRIALEVLYEKNEPIHKVSENFY